MTESEDYIKENARERERLRSLVQKLSDAELNAPLNPVWTIATILGHLAFWDDLARLRIESLKQNAALPPLAAAYDMLNESVRNLCRNMDARKLAQAAMDAAGQADACIEKLPLELAEKIDQSENARLLRRYIHRRLHLDKIESLKK